MTPHMRWNERSIQSPCGSCLSSLSCFENTLRRSKLVLTDRPCTLLLNHWTQSTNARRAVKCTLRNRTRIYRLSRRGGPHRGQRQAVESTPISSSLAAAKIDAPQSIPSLTDDSTLTLVDSYLWGLATPFASAGRNQDSRWCLVPSTHGVTGYLEGLVPQVYTSKKEIYMAEATSLGQCSLWFLVITNCGCWVSYDIKLNILQASEHWRSLIVAHMISTQGIQNNHSAS